MAREAEVTRTTPRPAAADELRRAEPEVLPFQKWAQTAGVASRHLTARATIVPMRDLYPTTTDASGRAYPAVLTPARADVFFASANRVMMAAERTFARAGQTLARADHTFELGAAR
jgi:hypothetical protein